MYSLVLFFALIGITLGDQAFVYDRNSGKHLLEMFKNIYEDKSVLLFIFISIQDYRDPNIPFFGALPSFVVDIKNNQPVVVKDSHFIYNFTASLSDNTVTLKYHTVFTLIY